MNALLRRTSIPRVRISSIEPWDIDDALLGCFSNPRLCPHLHIPLQSGSEAVLQRMARPFSAESFRLLMLKIQEKLPGLMISTDLITGFPGETEALFEETRAFVQEMDFSGGHVFKFSPMVGTVAARMDERVPERVSHARSQELRRDPAGENTPQTDGENRRRGGSLMGTRPGEPVFRIHQGLLPDPDHQQPESQQYDWHSPRNWFNAGRNLAG